MAAQIAVIRATLKYSTQDELIRGMAPLISRQGLFIHTRATRPSGSEVHFEFQLANKSQTYSGEGIVRKEVPYDPDNPKQKPGMLISLKRINQPFKEVVNAIISAKDKEIDAKQKAVETTAPKQHIIDTKSGGFDFFREVDTEDDMDDDLDSLFAGIEKKPSITNDGFTSPSDTNDLFFNTNPSELLVEYNDEDDDDGVEADDFDTLSDILPASPTSPTIQSQSMLTPQNSQSVQSELDKAQAEIAALKAQLAMTQREPSTPQRPPVVFSSSLEGNRFTPSSDDIAFQNAVTGIFQGTEELARAERNVAKSVNDDSLFRRNTKKKASQETLAALSAFSGLFTAVQKANPQPKEDPKPEANSSNNSNNPLPTLNLMSQKELARNRTSPEDLSKITIESLLKKEEDPIMQTMTGSEDKRKERSPQSKQELPTEKQSIFSNLFKK